MQPIVCSPHQITERHSHVVNFYHQVPTGLSLDDVTRQGSPYWANSWKRFEGRELSTIDLLAEDGTWEAQARIMKITGDKVSFRILRTWRDEESDIEVPKGYRVEFLADRGWRAVDPAGVVVIEGRSQKIDALTAALDHATSVDPKRKKVAA